MLNLKHLVLASLMALVPVTHAMADVTLINVFEVPDGKQKTVITAWEDARDFLASQPGYISTALHQSLQPGARFQLINIARWKSPQQFQTAISNMRKAGVFPMIDGLGINPSLYKVIRED